MASFDIRVKDMFINNSIVRHAGIAFTSAYPSVDSYADSSQNIHHVADMTVMKGIITWLVPLDAEMYKLIKEISMVPITHKLFTAVLHFTLPEQHKPVTINNIVIPSGEVVLPSTNEGGAQEVVLHGQLKTYS